MILLKIIFLLFTTTNFLFSALSQIPYQSNVNALSLPAAQKTTLSSAWANLYAGYNAALNSKPIPATSYHAASLLPAIGLEFMQNYINPKTFNSLPGNSIGTNYTTVHLKSTLDRFINIYKVTQTNSLPTITFTGDNRDLGVIVNIQNNTNINYSIIQSSLNEKNATQIGSLAPGFNAVNLHTAALQTNLTASNTTATISTNSIDFSPTSSTSNELCSLRTCTGQELITMITAFAANPAQTLYMNTQTTSLQKAANAQDLYLIIINNAQGPLAEKRIQALNISEFKGPYLINLQIENGMFSFVSTQIITKANQFPLIILPQFLWNLPAMQTYWTLLYSAYLSITTNFKFFRATSFASPFSYFQNLDCFDTKQSSRVVIDLYNTFQSGMILFNAPDIMGSAMYATNNTIAINDIPAIHTTQNSTNNIVGDGTDGFYLNLTLQFAHQKTETSNALFIKNGFNQIYKIPHQFNCIMSILKSKFTPNIFINISKTNNGSIQINCTDKNDDTLFSKKLYLNSAISNIKINFLNNASTWIGTSLASNLINNSSIPSKVPSQITNFKLTYNYTQSTNTNSLTAQVTSPIDKMKDIHISYFSKLPITSLYYDVYKTFNVLPFTRCYIIQNGVLPSFLANLTEQDWSNGIYLIPSIENNQKLSNSNPGALTITFYDSNKNLLGQIKSSGFYNNNESTSGIREPVSIYNLFSEEIKPLFNISILTGINIKYLST